MERSTWVIAGMLLAMATASAKEQTVYTCVRDGVRLFQDRACGPDQQVLELEVADAAPPPPGVQAELDYMAARHPGSRALPRPRPQPVRNARSASSR